MTLPTHYRRLAVFEPGPDVARATRIVETPLRLPGPGEVLIRTRFAGVNGSDPMAAAGGYGITEVPFDLGIEGGGEVVAIGDGVERLKVGDQGLLFGLGGYAEYRCVPAEQVFKVPEVTPPLVSAFVCGLTASVGYGETQSLRSGETVLVTAAAGGVGTWAVQLAVRAGNRVIGTCGDDRKAERLRALGCERVIQHRREDVDAVLRAEYPNGLDVVFESVGRHLFDTALEHLAPFGRLLTMGAVSEHGSGTDWEPVTGVRVYRTLLGKSASIRSALLMRYPPAVWQQHFERLQGLLAEGALQAAVDDTRFEGLESVPAAVAHQQSGRNWGKVVVRL